MNKANITQIRIQIPQNKIINYTVKKVHMAIN